jgi:hypothetical protein
MKLKIDTEKKTVTIDVTDNLNLGEVVDFLTKIYGDNWKEYNLISRSDYNYIYNPIPNPSNTQPFIATCSCKKE